MTDKHGRNKIERVNSRKHSGFIKLFYGSRALEWLNLRKLFKELLMFFHFSHLCSTVDEVTFAWSYSDNLSTVFYNPSAVFKTFSFADLLDKDQHCLCVTANRLKAFCDPLTVNESSSFSKTSMHVRTMDLSIVQHKGLRQALSQGMNHIPLRPSNIAEAIAIALDAFAQLAVILNLAYLQFPLEDAYTRLRSICLSTLKAASNSNKYGFKETGTFLLNIPAVQNELTWLRKHLYCSGLDKASSNACFMCIRHIRTQAFERLMGSDFSPCMSNSRWTSPTNILDMVLAELHNILPDCPPPCEALPYLMATFKQHKNKYRWLTNAHCTVFTNIAVLLTITSKVILDAFKSWARLTEEGYERFLNVKTNLFWLVDSIIDTTLNFPQQMSDVFVADITRCYESIPLQGSDNLLDAITFVTNTAFKYAGLQHPKANTQLWIRNDTEATPTTAKWATRAPSHGSWYAMPARRLLHLHAWLMTNCYVVLGDRVWLQTSGIPMGFSCSPVWCNMYLLAYEVKFMQRLARLGRKDLLAKFQSAYRYIDDLCLINVGNPRDFLSPEQPRTLSNPYWIYPLSVLEIKEETTSFDPYNPTRGISAHFMNVEISVNELFPDLYTYKKFDKRRALPFKYTQYIKFRSNRCVRQAYNIAISQVLPIIYVSNTDEAAYEEILNLIKTMTYNGFNRLRLVRIITQFLCKGAFPGARVDAQQISASVSHCDSTTHTPEMFRR